MKKDFKLKLKDAETILEECLVTGADFAEIFAQKSYTKYINMTNKKVQNIDNEIIYGVGLRICLGKETIYGFVNKMNLDSIVSLAKKLRTSFNDNVKIEKVRLKETKYDSKHKVVKPFDSVSLEEKVDILKLSDETMREYSDLINQTNVSLFEEEDFVLIANSSGKYISDQRNYLSFSFRAFAKKGDIIEDISDYFKYNSGYEVLSHDKIKLRSKEVAKKAVELLDAGYFKGGTLPVIIANGNGGVLIHEACGHSFEADSLVKNQSVFKDKLNQRVGNEILNIVDDGTLKNYWGSANIDDEGNFCEKIDLVKNGVLNSFLVDERSGLELNIDSNASCRRESYKYIPTARMHNTYVEPGESSISEMIKSIDYGVYIKELSGGSVSPATGEFNFGAPYGNVIRDGKVCELIKNMSLIGTGEEVLKNISMIGSDLSHGSSYCGSVSGFVPNCCGQPTIKIDSMTVGGRKEKK